MGKGLTRPFLAQPTPTIMKTHHVLPLLFAILASATIARGADTHPSPETQELANQANRAMAEENWTEARQLLETALEQTPDAPELWIGSGFTLVRLDRIEEARESYETALALYEKRVEEEPDNAGLVMNVGYTYVLLNRRDDAMAYLEAAAEHNPDEPVFERFSAIVEGLEENFSEFIIPEHEPE